MTACILADLLNDEIKWLDARATELLREVRAGYRRRLERAE